MLKLSLRAYTSRRLGSVLQILFAFLRRKIRPGFWGKIAIEVQGGEIKRVTIEQGFKPDELLAATNPETS